MAAYTRILLMIALCAGTAFSLKCYTCYIQSNNANCMTAENCTSGETYCKTTVTSAGAVGFSVVSITKMCAISCTATSTSFSVASSSVSCCSSDLCNTSGGASIKSSYAAIILALGSILTILKGLML
ncbi:lymphocyte antigen 6E-like [Rhinoderma darwinii]|uniref:lymphocyte antigen 6E-like n=1 Tax=Rhinoderma darwinii TaxID=43563 RepID=UPI003F66F7AC